MHAKLLPSVHAEVPGNFFLKHAVFNDVLEVFSTQITNTDGRLPLLSLCAFSQVKGNDRVQHVCHGSFRKVLGCVVPKTVAQEHFQHFLNCSIWNTESLMWILQMLEVYQF